MLNEKGNERVQSHGDKKWYSINGKVKWIMKKIKILDNKSNIGNYTFLNDENILPQQSSSNSYLKDGSVMKDKLQ